MGVRYNYFPIVLARMPEAAGKLCENGADMVAASARNHHPWQNQTGETEASIRSEQESDRLHQVALFGGASLFLEFGTVDMPPFPYIIPAADITRPKWIDMWLSLEAYLTGAGSTGGY